MVEEFIHLAGIGEIRQIRASGGGIKSAVWRQILANVLDTELATVNVLEGAAYGAALLAGVGLGIWPDVATACQRVVKISGITQPDKGQVEKYREIYPRYHELYPILKAWFQPGDPKQA